MHFNYTDAEHLRGFYYDESGKKLGLNYVKEGKKYEFCLKLCNILIEEESSSQEKAIERAKQLFNELKDLPYHRQNPITKVFEIVEELNENLRK